MQVDAVAQGRRVLRPDAPHLAAERHRDHRAEQEHAVEQQRHEDDAGEADGHQRDEHLRPVVVARCGADHLAEVDAAEDRVGDAREVHDDQDQVDVAVRQLRLHVHVHYRCRNTPIGMFC